MSVNELNSEMEEFVRGKISELNWIHTQSMIPIGQELAQQMGVDKEVVYYAIVFHDVAKDQNPDNHAFVGARICENFLQARRLNSEFISLVAHCVEVHAWAWGESSSPATDEARIVFDADMIQQLGQLGVLKHLAFKYGNLSSLHARITRTKEDLGRAADSVLTSAGRKMAATRKKEVDHILSDILQGR